MIGRIIACTKNCDVQLYDQRTSTLFKFWTSQQKLCRIIVTLSEGFSQKKCTGRISCKSLCKYHILWLLCCSWRDLTNLTLYWRIFAFFVNPINIHVSILVENHFWAQLRQTYPHENLAQKLYDEKPSHASPRNPLGARFEALYQKSTCSVRSTWAEPTATTESSLNSEGESD